MEHLAQMCCAACREKLEQIETRATSSAGGNPIAFSVQAIADRRELLMMIEMLLQTVTTSREALRSAHRLLLSEVAAIAQSRGVPP